MFFGNVSDTFYISEKKSLTGKKSALLVILLVLVALFYLVLLRIRDGRVYFTSLLISLISTIMMVISDPFPYSLNKIFYLFFLFFLGLAPEVQFESGTHFWSFYSSFRPEDYFLGNIILLVVLLVYSVTHYIVLRFRIRMNTLPVPSLKFRGGNRENIIIDRKILLYALVFASTFVTLYVHKFNLIFLTIRLLSSDVISESLKNQSVALIFNNFIRPIPAIALIILKLSRSGKKIDYFILLFLTLLTSFPLGTARYYTAAVYIPIIIAFWEDKFRNNFFLLNIIMIVVLIFVFPLLGVSREENLLASWRYLRVSFLDSFNVGDYDSYQMYLKVVSENFIPGPKQLLAVLLFFVPREWFPSKSIGSGNLVAHNFGYTWSNVSMNFFGEGFVNFGYFGIFLFAVIIAIINGMFDKGYWTKSLSLWKRCFYISFIGLEFFILRGDLLSSYAYTMGFLVSTLFLYHLCFKSIRKQI